MLHESGMCGEIVVLAMLEDEDAIGSKEILLEYQVGNLRKFLQGVGRISEDEVKLLAAGLNEAEYIATDWSADISA